jgi:hypothetical protein
LVEGFPEYPLNRVSAKVGEIPKADSNVKVTHVAPDPF